MESIRNQYQKFGVKNFYSFHAGQYENPHESIINKSLIHVYRDWNLDFSKVLDLAAGKGEVTKALKKLGVTDIDAADGFLSKEYTRETGEPCFDMSFDDIMKGSLRGYSYSLIICSFALHLLDESKLPSFLLTLTESSDNLLIISPHKKPYIKEGWGWDLKKESEIDRVKTRYFVSTF